MGGRYTTQFVTCRKPLCSPWPVPSLLFMLTWEKSRLGCLPVPPIKVPAPAPARATGPLGPQLSQWYILAASHLWVFVMVSAVSRGGVGSPRVGGSLTMAAGG